MQKLIEPEKPAVTLHGIVEKIIPENSIVPEKAQIPVEDADHLLQGGSRRKYFARRERQEGGAETGRSC
jgi:hypothetical protein